MRYYEACHHGRGRFLSHTSERAVTPAGDAIGEMAVTAVTVLREDSVVQIDLGPVSSPAAVRCLGRPRALPDTGPRIV